MISPIHAAPFFICAIVTVVVISCYQLLNFTTPLPPMSEPTWSSIYSGYLHRADLHPNPKTFTPIRSALELVVLRNSPVEHQGIDLAIFTDRVVVDSKGGIRSTISKGLWSLRGWSTLFPTRTASGTSGESNTNELVDP